MISVIIAVKCVAFLGAHVFYGLSLLNNMVVYNALMDAMTVVVVLCAVVIMHFLMFFTYSDTFVVKLLAGGPEVEEVPAEEMK